VDRQKADRGRGITERRASKIGQVYFTFGHHRLIKRLSGGIMKRKIIFLTAVLLLGALLFFWREKGAEKEKEEPSGTPTPVVILPRELKNVWILSSGESSITFFFEGETKTLSTRGKVQETLTECVGDLTVQGEEIVSLVLKPDKVQAKVLQADEDGMELEGYGTLPFAEGFRVYRLYGELEEEPSGKVLVGSTDTEFVLENGKLCAALLRSRPNTEKIRVLLGTEGYRGYYHTTVELTADCGYTVSVGEKNEHYEAGERYKLTEKDFEEKPGRRVVTPDSVDGKITFCNLKRAGGTPSYRGTLEIEAGEEGLLVVNEVSMEEYLYAVLPSEMPSDFGKEALKAQAICARSYAYTELLANRYARYGAHVDDSTACQVYNNIGETEAAVLAVKETHGQVLFYEGEVAQCYYYSTSSGHTAAAEDVWENAEPVPYLQAKETPYDEESPWYRWQTFLSLESLTERVEDTLAARYKAVPEQILTYDAAGKEFVGKSIGKTGEIKSIRVWEQGAGDIATKLLVVAEGGVFLVKNEYNIRSILAPVDTAVYREMGETVNGAALLPSAFITLQRGIYQGEEGYLVTGGGYGHGVGMSQCGADAMAQKGYSCEEIIEEYYPGAEPGFIYD